MQYCILSVKLDCFSWMCMCEFLCVVYVFLCIHRYMYIMVKEQEEDHTHYRVYSDDCDGVCLRSNPCFRHWATVKVNVENESGLKLYRFGTVTRTQQTGARISNITMYASSTLIYNSRVYTVNFHALRDMSEYFSRVYYGRREHVLTWIRAWNDSFKAFFIILGCEK